MRRDAMRVRRRDYRVPPLAAKPTSHKTPHARLFGPSTVHTRCICAAHKRSARLRDTTRCPRSIRDKPSDVLHRVQISISDPSARRAHAGHALPASFTAPWQTLGVVAVRQCTCSCSCEQCALLQRCRQVRYTKPATLRTFEAVELERGQLSKIQRRYATQRDVADTPRATEERDSAHHGRQVFLSETAHY